MFMEELVMNVQAYILTLTYETTLEELTERVADQKCDSITLISMQEREDLSAWVAPNWTTSGDIVFFYYAKSSLRAIRKLQKECERLEDSNKYKPALKCVLDSAEEGYGYIGGTIFAVGQVIGVPEIDESVEHSHFKTRIFSPVTNIVQLETVIPLEYFSEYLQIGRRQSITPVLGETFERLKNDILEDAEIDYLEDAHAVPVPLRNISEKNWLSVTMDYRRKFFLEIQFRKYYVDYFLKVFGDNKTFYEECSCFRNGKHTGVADNCIKFNGKYSFVEVKLNTKTVKNFEEQLNRYCNVDEIKLANEKLEKKENILQGFVFVIDVEALYIYVRKTQELKRLEFLNNIKCEYDIRKLRELCIKKIGG